ncbi:MAG: metal ABC transporter permease [Candidatus Thalassarchaeum sp.]|nr:metal ABC transporter permease [Candidatus Thalassarchaeum sp.]|tara:strand:- start:2701 stop:3624 length:924 start_codon:yes stop_codon:yes gene_type:complete
MFRGIIEEIGRGTLRTVSPILEFFAPIVPGNTFPLYFEIGLFQSALIAAILSTIIAGLMGSFLLIRNLSLIGDGLAHVSFGGVAFAIVIGSAEESLLWALLFSTIASILIYELQSRELLTGDASIAIFLTGMLALGLMMLGLWGGGITSDVHGYLWGSLNLITPFSLGIITIVTFIVIICLFFIHPILLATTIDPLAARVQGLPVRDVGLLFSVLTAAVVVSMVKIVGALLVTALLVTPAATAQFVGKSFRSCVLWTLFFGLTSTIVGIYFAAETEAASGAMIALTAATIFAAVATFQIVIKPSSEA